MTADVLALIEDASLNATAPPQQRWLDGWLLRLSPGKAKRARCILALATGRLDLRTKLALAEAAYAEARLPLVFRLTPFSVPSRLDALLDGLGFERFDETAVMTSHGLDAANAALPSSTRLEPMGPDAFAQLVGTWRGQDLAQRQAHAERLANAPVPFRAFVLLHDGERVACGQFALENEIAGVFDVFTASPYRNRGHATTLCRHLLAQARQLGAKHAYLQVELDNHAALAVYQRLGFAQAYRYHYRAPGGQAELPA